MTILTTILNYTDIIYSKFQSSLPVSTSLNSVSSSHLSSSPVLFLLFCLIIFPSIIASPFPIGLLLIDFLLRHVLHLIISLNSHISFYVGSLLTTEFLVTQHPLWIFHCNIAQQFPIKTKTANKNHCYQHVCSSKFSLTTKIITRGLIKIDFQSCFIFRFVKYNNYLPPCYITLPPSCKQGILQSGLPVYPRGSPKPGIFVSDQNRVFPGFSYSIGTPPISTSPLSSSYMSYAAEDYKSPRCILNFSKASPSFNLQDEYRGVEIWFIV